MHLGPDVVAIVESFKDLRKITTLKLGSKFTNQLSALSVSESVGFYVYISVRSLALSLTGTTNIDPNPRL